MKSFKVKFFLLLSFSLSQAVFSASKKGEEGIEMEVLKVSKKQALRGEGSDEPRKIGKDLLDPKTFNPPKHFNAAYFGLEDEDVVKLEKAIEYQMEEIEMLAALLEKDLKRAFFMIKRIALESKLESAVKSLEAFEENLEEEHQAFSDFMENYWKELSKKELAEGGI